MNAVAARASALIEAGGLQVRFDRTTDRIRHSVWMVADGNAELVLESVEDDGEPTEPRVPVLRDVHIQSPDDRRQIALLVGMSGRDHWSMSVEADPSTGQFSFDVACRIHSEAVLLGSIYRMVPPATVSVAEAVELSHPAAGGIQMVTDDDKSPSGGVRWRTAKSGRLQLFAVDASAPLPRTVRWQYGIRRVHS